MAVPASSARVGLSWSAFSTVAVGVLGLAGIVVVARSFGPAAYAAFASLWAVFFGIGGVFAGFQAEVTRAVSASDRRNSPRPAAALLVMAVPVAIVGAGVAATVSDSARMPVAVTVLCGLLGLGGLTLTGGLLAAGRQWRSLALLMCLDAVIRTGALMAVSAWGASQLLPLAIAAGPTGWLFLLLGPRWRAHVTAIPPVLDGAFFRRATVAMAASGCAAAVVAGLPLLVDVLRPGSGRETGAALAALVLIRSGLLVGTYGLRPVMLSHFIADDSAQPGRLVLWATVGAIGLGYVAVLTGIGPWALTITLGDDYRLSAVECGLMALGTVGLMCLVVTGMSSIADDRYLASGAGWVAALVATVVAVLAADSAAGSVLLASVVGPWVGVLVHAGAAVVRRSDRVTG